MTASLVREGVVVVATGFTWGAALALALSSTAQVLPNLKSSSRINTPFGERALSVLSFKDLSIVPLNRARLSDAEPRPAAGTGHDGRLGAHEERIFRLEEQRHEA